VHTRKWGERTTSPRHCGLRGTTKKKKKKKKIIVFFFKKRKPFKRRTKGAKKFWDYI